MCFCRSFPGKIWNSNEGHMPTRWVQVSKHSTALMQCSAPCVTLKLTQDKLLSHLLLPSRDSFEIIIDGWLSKMCGTQKSFSNLLHQKYEFWRSWVIHWGKSDMERTDKKGTIITLIQRWKIENGSILWKEPSVVYRDKYWALIHK